MRMTRQHYEFIAFVIRKMGDTTAAEVAANTFAKSLAKQSPGFDRQRFLDACRIGLPATKVTT